ncbi:coiled-coil domain-containing protein 47-like [Pecten maximus]|uniref:coiled-coil domain-containing protein 47-like n=1 Tax=Pecten maximus TaxID=6579 RepID=UPI001458704A|nr:coiled-coil domain-containing protein 47-like [Pecten maximus]
MKNMKSFTCCLVLTFILVTGIITVKSGNPHDADIEDNDFAEFEDFEDVEVLEDGDRAEFPEDVEVQQQKEGDVEGEDEDDSTIETEDDDDEFDHFTDEDEFIGFDKSQSPSSGKSKDLPDLKMAKVPGHLRTNWDSFYMEILMLAGLAVYFLNFIHGKNKNHKLAQAWLQSNRELLEGNFHIVGDDGSTKEAQAGTLMKESENVYALWCSGRTALEGMLVELRLLKRQDLISTMTNMFKPASDQILVTIDLDKNVMDKFVFAIATKRSCSKLHKEMIDLSQFTEKKNLDRYTDLPNSYQLLSEVGEASNALLDKKVCQVLTKFEGLVEFMHFSDQFCGAKSQDESQTTKMPEVKPVMIFCFNVPGKGKSKPADMEHMKPLLQLVFYCLEKVSRLQLGKEARNKSEKNRKKAEEQFLKAAHSQLQEAAQLRREEKRRQEKERMMNEEDPDKTRKWEERESRREMKRKQPKMKMMKI